MLGANIGAKYVFAGEAGFVVQPHDRCKGMEDGVIDNVNMLSVLGDGARYDRDCITF